MNYYFTPLSKGTVLVHEDVASYAMTEAQARENLKYIQEHREYYPDPLVYERRVKFYEDALEALTKGEPHE